MRLSYALIGCALLSGAAAARTPRTFIVTNPSAFARPDAIIELPFDGGSSVAARIHGRLVPTQNMERGVVRLIATLAPREKLAIMLVPGKAPEGPVRVRATLNVRDAVGRYVTQQSYAVPATHTGTDGLIAFEGIGWESDRAAYRIYLDGRNVVDLFGKMKPEMVFPNIGKGLDDYQYPRAWGGDIFKVGPSLGVGGIGLLRDGHPSQTGPARLSAAIANGVLSSRASVAADAIGGGHGYIHADYAITAGNAMTYATVRAGELDAPLVTGLTVHPGDQAIRSSVSGRWAYVAVWGPQEHGPDEVGTALFYRVVDAAGEPAQDSANLYIRFASPQQNSYMFVGRWTQENRLVPGYSPIADLPAFRIWLEQQREMFEKPLVITSARELKQPARARAG